MMITRKMVLSGALCAAIAPAVLAIGQNTDQNVDAHRNPNLAAAQASIARANQQIETAQKADKEKLGGHAQKAREELAAAARELKLAADYVNQHH